MSWPRHRRAHRRGTRIVALCSAAFLVAGAGLLEGRRATTHGRLADELAARHPRIRVEPDVLCVDLGDVATSAGTAAGTAAGTDRLLHLIRTGQGAACAHPIARHMVMPPHRERGPAAIRRSPLSERLPDCLVPVLDWAAERLHKPLSVDDLAAFGAVSARTLPRRFAEQLGTNPGLTRGQVEGDEPLEREGRHLPMRDCGCPSDGPSSRCASSGRPEGARRSGQAGDGPRGHGTGGRLGSPPTGTLQRLQLRFSIGVAPAELSVHAVPVQMT
ncbi:DJ-1/PfpI family protein [Streptomyces yangpuensis]